MEPKQRRSFTIKEKMSIIARLQFGANNVDLSKELNVSHSTISSIWKQRAEIQKSFESKSLKIKKIRKPNHEEIEKALLTWLEAQKKLQILVNGRDLQEKANEFAKVFGKKNYLCTESWIFRFRKRYDISVGRVSEEKSSNKDVSQTTTRVSNTYKDCNFTPFEEDIDDQIWNGDMGDHDPLIKAFKDPSTMKVSRNQPTAMEFDGKLLIREIKIRPLLYEKTSNDYSHLADRRKAWEDICETLIKGWESWNSAEKERAIFLANKRWSNMRNCFQRELKNQRREREAGVTISSRRKYYYYDDMLFLIGQSAPDKEKDELESDNVESEKSDEESDQENAEDIAERRMKYNSFETIDLIKALKDEPVIYNKALETSQVKFDRKNAWIKISKKIYGAKWKQWRSTEKKQAVEVLKIRWSNIRTCFLRELKLRTKQQHTKVSSKKRREYVYFKPLKFLLPYYDLEAIESKQKVEDYSEDDQANSDDQSMQGDFVDEEYLEDNDHNDDISIDGYVEATTSAKRQKSDRTTPTDIKHEKVDIEVNSSAISDPLQYDGSKEIDQDVNFALSLVPMMRELSATRKLEIQIEILRLFKKVST